MIDFDRSPLGTLLEVSLLQDETANWVERGAIDKILAEQRVQTLFAPEGGGERAKVARLLKADLLVLVRSYSKDKTKYVDLVVSEVSRGLRLVRRSLPVSAKTESDVQELLKTVQAGFEKRKADIQAIFAIPPFLSHDLVFEHEGLRGTYARLIEQQLLDQPQVLVVELAEADALLRERSLDDSADKITRLLPHFLLGEFRNEGKDKERKVKITLRLKHGAQDKGDSQSTLRPEEASEFLHNKVAAVLKYVTGKPPAASDPKLEAKQLHRRAEELLQSGDWQGALDLAEASLLVQSARPEPHVTAVHATTKLGLRFAPQVSREREAAEKVGAYVLHGLDHLSAFYRTGGKIDHNVREQSNFISDFFFLDSHLRIFPYTTRPVKEYLAEFGLRRRPVLLEMIDWLVGKDPVACNWYISKLLPPEASEEERFAIRKQFILKYQDLPGFASQVGLIATGAPFVDGHSLQTPAAEAFLAVLEAEGNNIVKQEVASMRKVREQYAARQKEKEADALATMLPSRDFEPVPEGGPRLSLEPFNLMWRDGAGQAGKLSGFSGWLATPDGFDVLWGGPDVYLMHQAGMLDRVALIRTPNSRIAEQSCVCYDGKYVWAVVSDVRNDARLFVIDPKTNSKTELTPSNGLPDPSVANPDRSNQVGVRFQTIALAPISAGKVLLAGGFGRAWLATATFDSASGGKIDIFHEAKTTPDRTNPNQWQDPTVSFSPSMVTLLEHPSRRIEDRRILVTRDTGAPKMSSHPLVIDPNTLKVEVSQSEFWAQGRPLDRSLHAGAIYYVQKTPPKFNAYHLLRIGLPGPQSEALFPLPVQGHVLAEKDRVHIIGKQWWIVDRATKQAVPTGVVPWIFNGDSPNYMKAPELEKLEGDKLALGKLAISNHHGIVAYYYGAKPGNDRVAKVVFKK